MTGLSDRELERYMRHILLREVGGTGQRRLKEAHVVVVGAGGLGVPVLMYLAAAGVGRITVIDDDLVSRSNLQRQVIYTEADIGQPKVGVAARWLAAQNPDVEILPVEARLTPDMATDMFGTCQLVVDGCDNFPTRYMVNQACVTARVPLLSGAITQWEGQLSLYDPARDAPCFACIFPEAPAEGLAPTCAEAGVIGALPGVVGAQMAAEAIKEITGAGQSLRGRLQLIDMLWGENRRISLARRADCAVCGGNHPPV
ncbi:HesA/MoeB/ThiF family protein [Thioclava kandeliae]|uniref:HesA/MoeB/ThiF family protein n=1 Tax=Thioclava kandeliae TaxID=3070818 RepID=A0ABV1SDH8_9RHOB